MLEMFDSNSNSKQAISFFMTFYFFLIYLNLTCNVLSRDGVNFLSEYKYTFDVRMWRQ